MESERRDAVAAAVERLPDHHRVLVGELFGPSLPSYAEVSSKVGMPIGSIGPTRERMLERLRRDARIAGLARA